MNTLFTTCALVCVVCALTGCGSGNSTIGSSPSGASTGVSLDSLRAAPSQVAVGGNTYVLSAVLYRNDQPAITSSGSAVAAPLIGTFTVSGTNGATVASGLTVTSAYVVENTDIGTFTNLSPTISSTINASSSLAVPSGSTDFTPGAAVEVVVQVQASDGSTYLLQEPSVKIGAVD